MDISTLAVAKSYATEVAEKLSKITSLDKFLDNTDIQYEFDESTGAYYTVVRIYKKRTDGTFQYPFVYAPNGSDAGDKSTLDIVTEDGWLVAINGGLFDYDKTKKPDGILIQDGVVVQNTPASIEKHIGAKPLTIDAAGDLGYAEADADAYELVANGIVSAVCGFLPIIVNYESVVAETANSEVHAQRQIIGQWGNGDYAIVTCEGRGYHNSDGWTLAEAQTICKKIGLKFAYNLDGGGSTETMLGYKNINTIYEGTTGRKVSTFIVFNGTNVFGKAPDIPEEPIKPNEDATYIYPEYLNVPAGAYINTDIPETEIYTCEYKALNADFITKPSKLNTRGHILSSANTYISFIKRSPTEIEPEIDVPYMLGRYKGGVGEGVITNEIDTASPHIIRCKMVDNTIQTSIDGYEFQTTPIGATANPNNKYYLFCYGGQPTAERYYFEGHFYYLQLRDASGDLVRNYKPAKRKSDNVCGLLDTVTKVFYPSDTNIAFA